MENDKLIKIFLSVWSPFYSPVFLGGRFLQESGINVTYDTEKGPNRFKRIKENKPKTVVAAAVSLHWESDDDDIEGIYHFAQINCRDGFFLVGKEPCDSFDWSMLNSKKILVSGRQPITALEYAIKTNLASSENMNVQTDKSPQFIVFKEKSGVEEILQDFRNGKGDFAHVQGYWAQQLVDEDENRYLVPVGQTPVPGYSFSSLMASNKFIGGKLFGPFMEAYTDALKFVNTKSAEDVVDKLGCFFSSVEPEILKRSIEQYKELGCWSHNGEITKDLYRETKNIFKTAIKDLKSPYEDVVKAPSFDSK